MRKNQKKKIEEIEDIVQILYAEAYLISKKILLVFIQFLKIQKGKRYMLSDINAKLVTLIQVVITKYS